MSDELSAQLRYNAKKSRELCAMSKDANASSLDDLDRLAAEKVMGWVLYQGGGCAMNGTYKENGEWRPNKEHWQPTRNIAQAWECLEKFDLKLEPSISWVSDDNVWMVAWWGPDGDNYVKGATASEAIVKACLKALKALEEQ